MGKHRIGIVGLSRGRGFVSVFDAHPDVEVTALCDTDEKKLADLGEAFKLQDSQCFTEFDEFVNADMDIVVIATPIPLHTEQTVKSVESGKHVSCASRPSRTPSKSARGLSMLSRSPVAST